jgi:aromatase
MPAQRVHPAQQAVQVAAPAAFVYGLLADARRWPLYLPRHVHVERIDFDGVEERLWTWEATPERVRTVQTHRVLAPHSWSVDFEQHEPGRPGATAAGRWVVEPQGRDRSLVTLHQEPSGPTPPHADPAAQLDHLRRAAERWEDLNELLFSFEDRVHVQGPAELVYGFLYRIEDWAGRLGRVRGSAVTEYQPGVQLAKVDTCGVLDPQPVTVESVRLCFPHAGRIVFKDLRTPAPIAAHTGEWTLHPDQHGVTVTASHQVLLRPQAVHTTPVQLRRRVRDWLGATTAEALGLAKQHAETAVRRLH